jgi:hypothetical protein
MWSVNRQAGRSGDPGLGERAGLGMGGKARESRLVVHDELPGVRRVEHVVGVALRQLRELGLERLEPRPALRGQVGARLAELGEGLAHEPRPHGREARGPGRRGEGLELGPEGGPQRDAGAERGHLREHPVVGLAQVRRIRDGLNVRDPVPGPVQRVGRLVEREEGVLEGEGALERLHRYERGLGPRDRRVDRRLHEVRPQRGPPDAEGRVEEGVFGHLHYQP